MINKIELINGKTFKIGYGTHKGIVSKIEENYEENHVYINLLDDKDNILIQICDIPYIVYYD